jgi:hypothetical protein
LDKSASFIVGAIPRRSTSSLDTAETYLVISRYLHFLRVVYLIQTEKNAKSELGSLAPSIFAGNTVFACLCIQVAAPVLLTIALTGGIRGLSRNSVLFCFVVPMFVVWWWVKRYVQGSESLDGLARTLHAESPAEQARWRNHALMFIWGNFTFFLFCFGAVIARAIIEGRGLTGTSH